VQFSHALIELDSIEQIVEYSSVPTQVSIGKVHFEPEFIALGDGYFALAAGPEILAASTPPRWRTRSARRPSTGTKITVDTMLKQYSASRA
jgi:hypothetical protein